MSQLRKIPAHNSVDYALHLINHQLAPLVNLTYEEQLIRKQNVVQGCIQLMSRKIKSLCSPNERSFNRDGIISTCTVETIRPAPLITGYRNKDEFSIWYGRDKKTKVVGFLTDSPAREETYCVEPDLAVISKESHKTLAKSFQNYIQSVTPLDVCTHFDRPTGNWRRFIVRSNQDNHHMGIAVLHPKLLTPGQLKDEKLRLKDYFESKASELSIKSLYFQACSKVRCSNQEAPFQLLFGDKIINETLLGFKFNISPESFFQTNTSGAEALYRSLIDQLQLTPDTIVLDLNCEVGTALIPIASRVKKVYGIDGSASAINDAYNNAASNGIFNCQFFRGDVLNIVIDLFQKLATEQHVIVIMKPKRDGISIPLLNCLREFEPIKQIAYLSTNPASVNAVSNFVFLSQPFKPAHQVLGRHFNPVSAIPVDMFPQTHHQALIMIFERTGNFLFS